MAEYINREEVERLMCEQADGVRLDDVPSIEIVCCKDCRWRGKPGCAFLIVDDSDKPKDDDYCSYGEKGENE